MILKEFCKILKREHGFTLTELMVGGAMLAGVALVGVRLMKEQKGAQRKVEYDQKLTLWHSELTKTMHNQANCNFTMNQLLGGSSGPLVTRSVAILWRCTANCGHTNSTTDTGAHDAFTPGMWSSGNSIIQVHPNVYTDAERVWRVAGMTIQGRNTTGTTTLEINYQLNPDKGDRYVRKKIFLNLRFSGGNFKECLDVQESNINNLQSDLCKSMNLTEINSAGGSSGDGRLAVWDDATQTCNISGVKNCEMLGAGMHTDSMSPDGIVRCRFIINDQDSADMSDNAPQTCPAGNKPQLYWNGGFKKFRVQCAP